MTSIQGNKDQSQQLEQVIHKTIPLSGLMGLEVKHLSNNSICLEAPVVDTNINIHGTAFAGSIYCMTVLSAWGFMYNRLLEEKITADVVVARAEIRYLSPIKKIICSECSVDEDHYNNFHSRLLELGKTSIPLRVNVREEEHLRATLDARIAVKITQS